ncbi:hypothetical protein GCM10011356_16810 [Kangiella profundi]|jgi:hypothetical protein|nr:hypothetical protein GCM10011356_16810 [Kangiella profundi]
MDEHIHTMKEGMQMINMGNGMKGGKQMDKMDMTKRMDMMEKHIGMMDRQSEASKSSEHQHK